MSDPTPARPVLADLPSQLHCSYDAVLALQRGMTNTKLRYGTGSDEHAAAVAEAESYGPALVADHLTLHGDINSLERIVNAAVYLYDNRLGWSDGRNPYAPPHFWDTLGRALGRDPAGFCDATPPTEPAPACSVVDRAAAAILAADLGLPKGDTDLADAVTALCAELKAARAALARVDATLTRMESLETPAFPYGSGVLGAVKTVRAALEGQEAPQ